MGGFRLLLAVNLPGAGGAVFCPAGAGEDARAADCAAAEFFRAEDGLFQLGLLGQHGAAKPPAKQARQELAQELAKFQSEQALKNVQKLPCSTEQKLELVDAAAKHLKAQQ